MSVSIEGVSPKLLVTENRVAVDYTAVTHTGTTDATKIWDLYTIPAGALTNAGNKVLVKIWGTFNSTGASDSMVVKMNGTIDTVALTLPGSPSAGLEFFLEQEILIRGAASQWCQGRLDGPSVIRTGGLTRTVNFNAAVDLDFYVTLANSGNSITFQGFELYLIN